MRIFCSKFEGFGDVILNVVADETHIQSISTNFVDGLPNALTKAAISQLEEYLAGDRRVFDLPLNMHQGTEFQRKVWNHLLTISYGEHRTYTQIAEHFGSKSMMRAVAAAIARTPIPILIPCHRVIGKNADMVGYIFGIDIKRNLLTLESQGSSCKQQFGLFNQRTWI